MHASAAKSAARSAQRMARYTVSQHADLIHYLRPPPVISPVFVLQLQLVAVDRA